MVSKISVVINTLNEATNIKKSVDLVNWADEIVVVDDGSTDGTWEILSGLKFKNNKLKIFQHKSAGYVEPARNFAISKALNEWILILDTDEQLPMSLVNKLQEIASRMEYIDYVRIPRKNMIFGYFMKASGWWPDYNIRFFKKGKVAWTDLIHRPPKSIGEGLDLPAEEDFAIEHHNYKSISEFIVRMDKYTTIQANELRQSNYSFKWRDIIEKPLSEFLSRFFAGSGYNDGLHGLAASLLQAFSFMVLYLKLWELEKFKKESIGLKDLEEEKNKSGAAINYWINKSWHPVNLFGRVFKKLRV